MSNKENKKNNKNNGKNNNNEKQNCDKQFFSIIRYFFLYQESHADLSLTFNFKIIIIVYDIIIATKNLKTKFKISGYYYKVQDISLF